MQISERYSCFQVEKLPLARTSMCLISYEFGVSLEAWFVALIRIDLRQGGLLSFESGTARNTNFKWLVWTLGYFSGNLGKK